MLLVAIIGWSASPGVHAEKVEIRSWELRIRSNAKPSPKATTLWFEDFESGFPGSMTTYKIGSQESQGWVAYSQSDGFGGGPMGTESAAHDDDNVSSDSCDDWIVSPAIDIPADAPAYLTFYHGTQFATSYTWYRGIWISTGSGDPSDGDFVEFADLSDSASNDAWTKLEFDLSAYAGQTVYIAFRYIGDYSDEWYLDSLMVWVQTALDNDLAVSIVEPGGSVSFGSSITPTALVKNVGNNDASDVTVVFNLYDHSASLVYSDTQTVSSLAAGDSAVLTFSEYTPASVGPYLAEVYHAWAADEDNANDTARLRFGVIQYSYTAYPASSSPTVDGVLDDEAWQGVDSLDISDFLGYSGDSADALGSAWMLAVHNFDTLFLAFVVPADQTQDQYDQMSWVFDDNNDDQWPATDTTEGANAVLPSIWYYAWFNQSGWSGWQSLSSNPPYAMDYSAGYLVVEVAVPIVHDPAEDVGPWTLFSEVTQGVSDTVGFFVYYIDEAATAQLAWWPQDVSTWYEPAQYAGLVLAGEMGAAESPRTTAAQLRVLGVHRPVISLNLPHPAEVKVSVYDASGRLVKALLDGRAEAGLHRLSVGQLKPGVYSVLARVGGKAYRVKFVAE